jgi:FAD/FMN-containing dehydrogenase
MTDHRDQAADGLLISGSDPDWRGSGLDPLPRLGVATGSMDRILHMSPADLTIEVESGMRVGELGRLVRQEGLWLPLADDLPGRSVGGLVAEAPPSSFDRSFGPVRRHVLACSIVHHDGRFTRWGRAVMKNVAGYDVPKLVCGSRGRLGIIASVTLRLWPRPESLRRFVLRGMPNGWPSFSAAPRLDGLVARRRPGGGEMQIRVALAGGEASVERRSSKLAAWAAEHGLTCEDRVPGEEIEGEERVADHRERTRDEAVYRIAFGRRYVPDGLGDIERWLETSAGRAIVESFPDTGRVRVEARGLEPAGRRRASAGLTAIMEAPRGRHVPGLSSIGPALRIERGGPAEHEVSDRLRPSAARQLERRLVTAFGGRQVTWQADFL